MESNKRGWGYMNAKQKRLLLSLRTALFELSAECIDDTDFNDKIASLRAFSRSIDEIAADLSSLIDESLEAERT